MLADGAMEVVGLGFEAIVNPSAPGPTDGRRQVDQDGEGGHQTAGRPQAELAHLVDPEVTPGALIGDRGVHVAVGDDHLAASQRRPDEGLDVVRPVRGEQQGLRTRGHVVTVQYELTNGAAEVRATRLPGHDHGVTEPLEPRTQ